MHYKRSSKSLRDIANELQVEYVIEGSIASAGDDVRVTAQLIEARTERHVWARVYDRKLQDVLALQTEVAGTVAEQVRIQLSPDEQARLSEVRIVEPEALKLYLLGRYHWNRRTPEDFQRSVEYFQRAISRDPEYARAYAGLADAYNMLGSYHVVPIRESHPEARRAALKALAIDPDLAEAHASLATITSDFYWEWDKAERHFVQAIELNPSYATARMWYAQHLVKLGRWEEADEQSRLALTLDPLSLIVSSMRGLVLRLAGRNDEAVKHLESALDTDPNFIPAHIQLGLSLIELGDLDRAVTVFERASVLGGEQIDLVALHGYALATGSRHEEARRLLAQIEKRAEKEYVAPYVLAPLHCALGDTDQALRQLEAAYAERDWLLGMVAVEPALASLHSETRYINLLRRLGLPEIEASR